MYPKEYLERMQNMLGGGYPSFLESLNMPPIRGLVINTLKINREDFINQTGWELSPVKGVENGFELKSGVNNIGLTLAHRLGLFYVKEPSSMHAAALTKTKPAMRVLDMCAAPGGKSAQLACMLNGEGLLVANDINYKRALVLKGNIERLGVRNALITCMHPKQLARELEAYFDVVLVDAPCSGEGMFRKDIKAIEDWSLAHVDACANRQAEILGSAAVALRPDGRLVYSTCTFSHEENEALIEAFLKENSEFELLHERRYYPHRGEGEGQYVAALIKHDGEHKRYKIAQPQKLKPDTLHEWERFLSENINGELFGHPALIKDSLLILMPELMPANYCKLNILGAGVHAGSFRNGRFIPGHALCSAYGVDYFKKSVHIGEAELKAYFRGHEIACDIGLKGYAAVCAGDFAAGWGKASSGALKNHLPKGLHGEI